jgi:hypothetical protein
VRAGAARGHLAAHYLMYAKVLGSTAEDGVAEVGRTDLLALRVFDLDRCHRFYSSVSGWGGS